MLKKILLGILVLVLLAAGGAAAYFLRLNDRPEGHLETSLTDISVSTADPSTDTLDEPVTTTTADEKPKEPPESCWKEFGGNPQRTNFQPANLGRPVGKARWARATGGLMEYGPTVCDGRVYVNTLKGHTRAYDARTGRLLWTRMGGLKPSSPAIAGPRLVVTSHDGTALGLNAKNGKILWRINVRARIESSPVVMDDIAYFGVTDGRLFAVNVRTGAVRWAYDTGGRINSSPSVWGDRICISNYAGAVFCLRRSNGTKLWSTYVRRNSFSYESFYASPSTDGRRIFTIARTGKVVAFDARSGRVLWTQHLSGYGYATPAVAHGLVFTGGRGGTFAAFDAASGRERWRRSVGGPVAGAPLVVGNLVFVSTMGKTFAYDVRSGETRWQTGLGHFIPGAATDRLYYFSLSGLLVVRRGENSPKLEPVRKRKAKKQEKS
jgi:outer membrane protein assembly factor BamB